MPVISIFSGMYCKANDVVQKTIEKTGYRLVTDRNIATEASKMSGMPENKIMKAFSGKTSVFNRFTHEKERLIAQLRLALAGMLSEENMIISGFSGLLIPRDITHTLQVCIIADVKSRTAEAMKSKSVSEKEAIGIIEKNDAENFSWVNMLFKASAPWDASLYDIVIPTNKVDANKAAELFRQIKLMPTRRRKLFMKTLAMKSFSRQKAQKRLSPILLFLHLLKSPRQKRGMLLA